MVSSVFVSIFSQFYHAIILLHTIIPESINQSEHQSAILCNHS